MIDLGESVKMDLSKWVCVFFFLVDLEGKVSRFEYEYRES